MRTAGKLKKQEKNAFMEKWENKFIVLCPVFSFFLFLHQYLREFYFKFKWHRLLTFCSSSKYYFLSLCLFFKYSYWFIAYFIPTYFLDFFFFFPDFLEKKSLPKNSHKTLPAKSSRMISIAVCGTCSPVYPLLCLIYMCFPSEWEQGCSFSYLGSAIKCNLLKHSSLHSW